MYEHPATRSWPGFVGTSNLVEAGRGAAHHRLAGRCSPSARRKSNRGRRPTRRSPAEFILGADGRVRDVIYLGMYTRYLVELDGGGDLVVVEQNLKTTSMDVLAARGGPCA